MTLSKISLAAVLVLFGISAARASGVDYNDIANDANTVIVHASQAIALLQPINKTTYPEAKALLNRAVDIRNRAVTMRAAALNNYSDTAKFLAYALDTLQRAEVCENYSGQLRQHAQQLNDNATKQKAHDIKEHFDEMGDKCRRIKNELD